MKAIVQFLSITMMAIMSACSSSEELYANWYDYSAADNIYKNIAEEMRENSPPLKDEVDIEAYPNMELLSSDPTKCIDRNNIGCKLKRLILVSKDSKKDIVDWYKLNLPNYMVFEIPSGTIFIETKKQEFIYPEDTGLFLEHRHVKVSSNKTGSYTKLAPGYNSIIEVAYTNNFK